MCRPVRLAIYYTLIFSSSLGFLINATQIVGALRDAPGSQSTFGVLQNLGIDGAFVLGLAYLIRSDLQVRGVLETPLLIVSPSNFFVLNRINTCAVRVGELSLKSTQGNSETNCRLFSCFGCGDAHKVCAHVGNGIICPRYIENTALSAATPWRPNK